MISHALFLIDERDSWRSYCLRSVIGRIGVLFALEYIWPPRPDDIIKRGSSELFRFIAVWVGGRALNGKKRERAWHWVFFLLVCAVEC